MMHRWLSLVAVMADKPSSGDTLFQVLFVLAMLALLGVLGAGIWMFRTGRWLVASHQNAPLSSRNFSPSVYRTPRMSDNPPIEIRGRVSSAPPPERRVAQPPDRYGPPPAPLPSPQRPTPPVPPEPRDNLLRDTRWLNLAQDCAYLFDELDENMANFDAPRQEMARHVKTRLREILVHSNVEAIDHDPTFNENRHQLEQPGATAAPGTPIVSYVSPGFAVDRRVLRRAVVRVASENEE